MNPSLTSERYFVSKLQLTNESGDITEIAMAIPLNFCDDKMNLVFETDQYDPVFQDVFAYLPLRSYGFRFSKIFLFIINVDI